MNVAVYNEIIAAIILTLAAVALALVHRRHTHLGLRYLLGVVVLMATVNLVSAVATAVVLTPEQGELARFVNAALRTVVLILLIGFILHRPRHVR